MKSTKYTFKIYYRITQSKRPSIDIFLRDVFGLCGMLGENRSRLHAMQDGFSRLKVTPPHTSRIF